MKGLGHRYEDKNAEFHMIMIIKTFGFTLDIVYILLKREKRFGRFHKHIRGI